jgi:LysR family glycine cleavage system transcriptional activator
MLPSLSALRVFEAAARHRSFKRAAAELHVTPTAVSHQIRLLEETLGLRLFERKTRQIVLTPSAEVLFPVVRESFDAIARALAVVSKPPDRGTVTLSATTAFTAKWLVPRIEKLSTSHPNVVLRLQATDELVDLDDGSVDLAVRYGRGPYPRCEAIPLVVDRFAVVASPRLRVRRPSELERQTRLEFEWRNVAPSNPTWARWFSSAGLVHRRTARAVRFSDESHAIQAAVAGQGVALLSLTLVTDELRANLLEVPFGPILEGPTYTLVHARARPLAPAAQAVKAWIIDEMEKAVSGRFDPADRRPKVRGHR